MPIKFNITKHDVLSGKFRQLVQKYNGSEFSSEDVGDGLLHAQATLIASFSPGHSWQTNRALIDRDTERLRSSLEVKNEYTAAKRSRWKMVGSKDIQEVSQMNIADSLFSVWLAFNTEKEMRELYRAAWMGLNKEFQEECDNRERAIGATARI
ncbi:MAG: hypothetical protein KGH94_05495 [Candidatus Micrarchaeota archaeon]|nr:hypothetical protein [Candidatus Micrarchaeota archaeon]